MRKYTDKIFIVLALILVITGLVIKKNIGDKKEKSLVIKREESLEKVEGDFDKSGERGAIEDMENEEKNKSVEEKSRDLEKGKLQDKDLKAYISGEVNKPGVYIFKRGDRINDLVEKADGFTKNADTNLNLALHLEDEMHIVVLDKRKEAATNQGYDIYLQDKSKRKNSRVYEEKDYKYQEKNSSEKKNKVDINTASLEELMTLPFIGEKKAKEIREKRARGKFESIDEIKSIKGIGDKTFEKLKDLITCNW